MACRWRRSSFFLEWNCEGGLEQNHGIWEIFGVFCRWVEDRILDLVLDIEKKGRGISIVEEKEKVLPLFNMKKKLVTIVNYEINKAKEKQMIKEEKGFTKKEKLT